MKTEPGLNCFTLIKYKVPHVMLDSNNYSDCRDEPKSVGKNRLLYVKLELKSKFLQKKNKDYSWHLQNVTN